ncbi:hypothetical protein [Methylobacterium sp. WL120]|uniref:hypothetical protein n=1 Tax=Methylobacterium sp. WL120 TaxID=2603887 RepID=UPI0011CAA1D9|nr:hypothetical protein [Methylobacterium sp. WL120]TXM68190.1 hypothetical protein FV229_08440 [Methylobacterium sp. WL120]
MQTDLPVAPPSWAIPGFGRIADEPVPQWILDRMIDGSMRVNSFGGFDMTANNDIRSSGAGDIVMLLDDGIEFFTPTSQPGW